MERFARRGLAVFHDHVKVDDVGQAIERVKELGGTKVMGRMDMPDGSAIGLFTDPEGHLIGLHGPA